MENANESRNVSFAPPIVERVEDGKWVFALYGFLFGVLLILFTFWLFGISNTTSASKPSYFYQDLNKVEMEVREGSPIDPEVVKNIHHFQKMPFGQSPAFASIFEVWSLFIRTIELLIYSALTVIFAFLVFSFF
jgi:hypothetical protein